MAATLKTVKSTHLCNGSTGQHKISQKCGFYNKEKKMSRYQKGKTNLDFTEARQ